MDKTAVIWTLAKLPPTHEPTTHDGYWIVAAIYALLIVMLLLIPAQRIGHGQGKPPAWKNVRYWAIAVATAQLLIYLLWRNLMML